MSSLRYGADHLIFQEDGATVWTPREMPDWEVKNLRPTKIVIQNRDYVIAAKHVAIESTKVMYRLEPWGNRVDIPGRIICYDEQYVTQREADYKDQRRRERASALSFAYPLIGFAWTSTKDKLEEKYGICPVRATKWSVAFEVPFALIAALAFWFAISLEGLVEAAVPMVLLGSDLLMRIDDLMHELPVPRGFLEWIWHRQKRTQT